MAHESLTVHGDMDAMVCVAGATGQGTLAERSVEQWNLTFNLNTRSVLLMAQAAYPSLKRKRGSLIKGATPEASEVTGFALGSFHNYSLPHRSTYANNRHDRPRHREQLAQAWSHFGPAFSMNNSLKGLSHYNQMAIDTHADHTVAQAVKNTQETACHQGDPNALVPSLIDLLLKRQKA